MKFRAKLWKDELKEILYSFSNLHDPIVIQKLLEIGFANSRLMHHALAGYRSEQEQSGNEVAAQDVENLKNEFIGDYTKSVSAALDVYKRQVLVLFTTHLEVITEEFVQSLFFLKPEMMFDYTGYDKGLISINDALKFKTRNAMIKSLAIRATAKLMEAKWPTIFSRVEKAIKLEVPEKSKLLKLIQTRNLVVHENRKPSISCRRIYSTCSMLERYIDFCGEVLTTPPLTRRSTRPARKTAQAG
jgi:hypothetical protein